MRKKILEGSVKRHPDGFGFFIPDNKEEPDVYIPRQYMTGVMANDRVKVSVTPEPGGNRFRGEVLDILTRAQTKVVGVFTPLNTKFGMIRDEGHSWGSDLRIPLAASMGAKKGQLISADITSYPEEEHGFQGVVSEILGDAEDPLTDVKRVLISNSIPHEWPKSVLNEAKGLSEHVDQKDMQGRRDVRDLKFITIDGKTAKDFDDAILVESTDRGFRLYVAIADVSHYVRPGSAIDGEAYTRGTSVYFPNFVVPMLPEVLSNGLCSLNPHLPRLALVSEMEMDFQGQVLESDFYEAVIESKARVTYGEAQELMDGGDVGGKLNHVRDEILRAQDLAKILMAKRFREGALDLEIPETQIVLDSSGLVTDMVRSERLFAHRLIEEMMLAANVEVAKFISAQDIPGLYRIHDSPNTDAISMLERYIHNFGGSFHLNTGKLQKRLTKALQDFEGKPEALILNILTLRSMSQAKYSPDNIGHFGLGFEFYSHFTSPIRRYPDLIIHRLLKSQLHVRGYKPMSEDDLQTAGLMLSACEQRAVKAERQFVSIKKARFIKQHLGKEFDGMISSVTKFGVFVLLRQFEVDGLVRMENLSKEKLFFDEESLRLVGKRSGIQFCIGDQVRVRVDKAEAESGQIDFGFMGKLDASGKVEVGTIYVPRSRGEKFSDRKGGGRHQKSSHKDSHRHARSEKSAKSGKSHPRSKKLQYADKKETQTAHHKEKRHSDRRGGQDRRHRNDHQTQTPPAQAPSRSGFDPASHFDKVMAKWKERQAPSLQQPGRRRTDEEEESPKAERLHFGDRYTGKKTTKKNDGGQRRSHNKSRGFRK